jgi:hypothetical protein
MSDDIRPHIAAANSELLTPDGAPADRGTYLVVWKNEHGAWKLRRDIRTTSQPASGA